MIALASLLHIRFSPTYFPLPVSIKLQLRLGNVAIESLDRSLGQTQGGLQNDFNLNIIQL